MAPFESLLKVVILGVLLTALVPDPREKTPSARYVHVYVHVYMYGYGYGSTPPLLTWYDVLLEFRWLQLYTITLSTN